MKLFACLLWLAVPAQAYLPQTRLILDKATKNAGRGLFQVEQEVQFPADPEILTLKETWWVQDGETLRVTVRVPAANGTARALAILYKGPMRYQADSGGVVKSSKLSSDAIEPFFHFRSADGLGKYLLHLGLISSASLSETHLSSLKHWKPEADPGVSLDRVKQSIALALGPRGKPPHLWIDQEQFVIRKIKLPSGAEVIADNHEPYTKNLIYPKDRTITWGDTSVHIRTLSVQTAPESATRFTPQGLGEEKITGLLPEVPRIREFYSRFR